MTTLGYYTIGEMIRLRASFRDGAGVAADPDEVTLYINPPDGVVITKTGAELSNDAVGEWHFDHLVATSGRYHYRWEGLGAVQTAREWEFRVRRSVFG